MFSIPKLPHVNKQSGEKIQNDSLRIRVTARFVIVIGTDGSIKDVINNKNVLEEKPQPIVCVLAPTIIGSKLFPETVVFEMTYRRAVPYKRIEENLPDGGIKIPITFRNRVREITEPEVALIWDQLQIGLKEILSEELARRETNGERFWLGRGMGFYRGCFFRCSNDDEWLSKILWEEHLRYRTPYFKRLLNLLSGYKYSYYPEKQLRSFQKVNLFVEKARNLRPIEQQRLIDTAGNLREFVGNIFDAFGIQYEEGQKKPPREHQFQGLTVYMHRRNRRFHASGCFSFEFLFLESKVARILSQQCESAVKKDIPFFTDPDYQDQPDLSLAENEVPF